MTTQPLSIPRSLPDSPALNQSELRARGLELIRRLSGSLWTDHNLHDPGVTIAEVACYALTELGHKARLAGSEGLLDLIVLADQGIGAQEAAAAKAIADHFFLPEDVLPCRPITVADYRRLLTDLDGVRNAWIRPVPLSLVADLARGILAPLGTPLSAGHPELREVGIRGRYEAIIELEPTITDPAEADVTLAEARAVLERNRNLCEEFVAVRLLETVGVSLCAELDIAHDVSPERTVANVERAIAQHLSPGVRSKSLAARLAEARAAGRRIELADVIEGPLLAHGFIETATNADSADLPEDDLTRSELASEVHLSDCIAIILKVPGVLAVRRLEMNILDSSGVGVPTLSPWRLLVPAGKRPRLSADNSCIACRTSGVPVTVDPDRVAAHRRKLDVEDAVAIKRATRDAAPLPKARLGHLDGIASPHRSIQHDLPATYGVGSVGLPKEASEERRIRALQLKGYLLFFDQIIANFAAQLRAAPRLLARGSREARTYFAARVTDAPDHARLYHPDLATDDRIAETIEKADNAAPRQNSFADHLLARLGEDLTGHLALVSATLGDRAPSALDVKRSVLAELPALAATRALAFDRSAGPSAAWDSNNVAGIERRIARLLGIAGHRRGSLLPPSDGTPATEGFHLLEHILLAPRQASDPLLPICVEADCETCSDLDPYSYRVQIVLPAYAGRFQTMAYREHVERLIRDELPAHLMARICWVSADTMLAFEAAYQPWLRLASGALDLPRVATMQTMIDRMTDSKSVYPQGHLAAETTDASRPRFILGRSALGTFDEEEP